jgi:cyclic pyranopterin phosphate synthase
MDQLSARWPLSPVKEQNPWQTARRYAYADGAAEVGFINSISEPFCRGCDRARISAEGKLYTCLFAQSGVSLRDWIRSEQLSEDELRQRLITLWSGREDRYSEIRGNASTAKTAGRPEMWRLGG